MNRPVMLEDAWGDKPQPPRGTKAPEIDLVYVDRSAPTIPRLRTALFLFAMVLIEVLR